MPALLLQAADNGHSWPDAIIVIGDIAMVTIIVVVAIWQVFASWCSRMSVAREEAYRKLAEDSMALQKQLAEQQTRMERDLATISGRVCGIEKVLEEVG